MSIYIDAIYQDGALHLPQPLALPDGAHVRLVIETIPPLSAAQHVYDPLTEVIGTGDGPIAHDDRHLPEIPPCE